MFAQFFTATSASPKQARTRFRGPERGSAPTPDGARDDADTNVPHAAVLGAMPCGTSDCKISGRVTPSNEQT